MHCPEDTESVRWTVEEIGIAEGNVCRALCHLFLYFSEHNVAFNNGKLAVINRWYRTVCAEMLTPVRCLRITDGSRFVVVLKLGINLQQAVVCQRRYRYPSVAIHALFSSCGFHQPDKGSWGVDNPTSCDDVSLSCPPVLGGY